MADNLGINYEIINVTNAAKWIRLLLNLFRLLTWSTFRRITCSVAPTTPTWWKARDSVTIVKVDSSAVLKIGYDDSRLFVEFVVGKWYKYVPVTKTVFEQFIKAPSKGYFVNKFIKTITRQGRVVVVWVSRRSKAIRLSICKKEIPYFHLIRRTKIYSSLKMERR